MISSLSNQAQALYNAYAFKNSEAYEENAVDPSAVSANEYNVSNISNALDALNRADSVSFASIGKVDSYVQSAYRLSQLDDYDTLSGSLTSAETRLVTGDSGSADIYSLIEYSNTLSTDELKSIIGSDDSTAADYISYLNQSCSIINTKA
jgi:hypothetical protein